MQQLPSKCASGSLDQVMNGRHFNRGMRVHSHMLAAVERLLVKVFVERNCIDITAFPEVINLAKEPNASTFGKMNSSTRVNVLVTDFCNFLDDVRR